MRSRNNLSEMPVTLGDLMRSQRRDAVKAAAMFMAVALYGAVLLYTGVHNFNLISRTVSPDQQLFAITALLCLEGAAIFLPLAIHFWLAPGPQRLVGYLLYAANFTIVVLNTILDAMTHRAESMPDWLNLYATFIVPATPVLIGIGIAFIFILDPSKKIHDARAAAESASMDAMALHMREAANRDEVNEAIRMAALKDMQEATSRVVGVRPKALPAPRRTGRGNTARKSPDGAVTVFGAGLREMSRLSQPRKSRSRRRAGG